MSVWMVETFLATTLLMALVMMLRRPVARWLGAGAAYWLWALPLARMLLPAIPREVAAPSPLHSAIDQAGLPALIMPVTLDTAATAPEMATPFPWLEGALALWAVGALLFLAVQAIGYLRFRRLILRGASTIAQDGRLRIVASPSARGPLAFGVLHPHIVLPMDFDARFDPLERDMAVAHERAHHEHGDLAANMVALLLLGLHWCNPIAWIAYRAFRADQEQACDARVLALYGVDNAHVYGRAILKAAGGRPFAAACHLTPVTALKGRLKMLSTHELSLRRISWGMAAVGTLTFTGLALTASGSRAAQQVAAISDTVSQVQFSRLTDLVVNSASAKTEPGMPSLAEAPVPPAPPAIPATLFDAPPVAPVPPAPPAPPALPARAAEAMPPLPPLPPTPPVVRTYKNKIVVMHPDGRKEVHRIPSEEDIRRMVPDIDIAEGCEGEENVTRSETVDAGGRRHVRMRICHAAIERQANAAALEGLRAARDTIARTAELSEKTRADVLRELDEEIADMRAQRN
ncbi:MAG: M56 family metallopeptidase [Sphingobium sp.]